jgi:2-C-methyl-D-erythritol 4-phosphate cytidylyltransferase
VFGAIIVAAGQGRRMGGTTPKQFIEIEGKSVLTHTVEKFLGMGNFFGRIAVMVPSESVEPCRMEFSRYGCEHSEHLLFAAGGSQRQDSVYKGLLSLGQDVETVVIHDGVRPFASTGLIKKLALLAQKVGAAIPAISLKDTLKEVDGEGRVLRTLPREGLYLVQTPQCFRREIIWDAHRKAARDEYHATDDAMLVENCGYTVMTVPGEPCNIKLTTVEDLFWARMFLKRESKDVQDRNRL